MFLPWDFWNIFEFYLGPTPQTSYSKIRKLPGNSESAIRKFPAKFSSFCFCNSLAGGRVVGLFISLISIFFHRWKSLACRNTLLSDLLFRVKGWRNRAKYCTAPCLYNTYSTSFDFSIPYAKQTNLRAGACFCMSYSSIDGRKSRL